MTNGQAWLIFIATIVCGTIAGTIGKRKGREGLGIILGLFLSVIGIVIIACMAPIDEARIVAAQKQYEIQAEAARRAGYPPAGPPPPGQWPNEPPGGPWQG